MKHMAMNIITGEIVENRRGNQLKRNVAIIERYDRKYYKVKKGKWIFAHGSNAYEKITTKMEKAL